ncbi:hypothetical protein, partial [Streptomyces alkaliphilus]|uniref:hypothetical protein n=1 Tax=Streptomyces alkaliphilus TaxID=1472722 RepID=UPI0015645824
VYHLPRVAARSAETERARREDPQAHPEPDEARLRRYGIHPEQAMSVEAREWVWEHSAAKGTARLVLLSIADRVPDEQCVAWASLTSLMARTNASRTAVRDAIAALVAGGELRVLDHLRGPHRTTVYHLPRVAARSAETERARREDPQAHPEPDEARLRRYGIHPEQGPDSEPSGRNPTGTESGPGGARIPSPRGAGIRPGRGTGSDPQNRREPKVNRRKGSGGGAPTPAGEWRVDPATRAWIRDQGHLDRLGEDGLRAADAKWRAHRAAHGPRPADIWAADWRSWIAREPVSYT